MGQARSIEIVKGHRTKAEIKIRTDAEKGLASGVSWKEWPETRADPLAHKEYARLTKIFKSIEKNDGLLEGAINRYAQLTAEVKLLTAQCGSLLRQMDDARERYEADAIGYDEYISLTDVAQARWLSCDKQLMSKRKMLLDIEKEMGLTLSAVLRAIPKKPQDDDADDPMSSLLGRGRGV